MLVLPEWLLNVWEVDLLLPVFDTGVCVFDFEQFDVFEGKEKADAIIDGLFELPEVLDEVNVPDAQGGRALSTVHLHKTHVIPELLSFKASPLGRWVLTRIFESAILLGFHKARDIKRLKYHRTWANRMSRGCDAVAHRHANNGWSIPHLVAIYYTDVPEGSADLVFIDDDNPEVMRGERCDDYPESKRHRIESKAGRLVCHDARLLHATTVHESDLPRTCLIIEVGFPPLL
jgi:hypothetical protein